MVSVAYSGLTLQMENGSYKGVLVWVDGLDRRGLADWTDY